VTATVKVGKPGVIAPSSIQGHNRRSALLRLHNSYALAELIISMVMLGLAIALNAWLIRVLVSARQELPRTMIGEAVSCSRP